MCWPKSCVAVVFFRGLCCVVVSPEFASCRAGAPPRPSPCFFQFEEKPGMCISRMPQPPMLISSQQTLHGGSGGGPLRQSPHRTCCAPARQVQLDKLHHALFHHRLPRRVAGRNYDGRRPWVQVSSRPWPWSSSHARVRPRSVNAPLRCLSFICSSNALLRGRRLLARSSPTARQCSPAAGCRRIAHFLTRHARLAIAGSVSRTSKEAAARVSASFSLPSPCARKHPHRPSGPRAVLA